MGGRSGWADALRDLTTGPALQPTGGLRSPRPERPSSRLSHPPTGTAGTIHHLIISPPSARPPGPPLRRAAVRSTSTRSPRAVLCPSSPSQAWQPPAFPTLAQRPDIHIHRQPDFTRLPSAAPLTCLLLPSTSTLATDATNPTPLHHHPGIPFSDPEESHPVEAPPRCNHRACVSCSDPALMSWA